MHAQMRGYLGAHGVSDVVVRRALEGGHLFGDDRGIFCLVVLQELVQDETVCGLTEGAQVGQLCSVLPAPRAAFDDSSHRSTASTALHSGHCDQMRGRGPLLIRRGGRSPSLRQRELE